MLATLVNEPFDDKAWVFETKWDGFRLVTDKRRDGLRLWSRNGIEVTQKYAALLPAIQKIEGSCVIDGGSAHSTRTGDHGSSFCRTLSTKGRRYSMWLSTRSS